MKTRLSNPYLASLASVLTLAVAPQVFAVNATWNGSPTDATWATVGNWAGPPASVPGSGETATFNNAGGAIDIIDLGAGVTINALLFDTASVAAYTIGSGGAGAQTLNLDGASTITLNNTIAANQLINANVTLGTGLTITNSDTSNTLTIAGGISGTGSTFTKSGVGTVILSGLSTTAANNYTGTTTLGGGTLRITQNASFSGGLTFGATDGSSTVSTLNLSDASATFAGTMLVRTSSTSTPNNTITIGAGQKLINNGDVLLGSTTTGVRPRLNVSGGGTWDVIKSNGTFAGIGTAVGNQEMIVDMSSLADFNANLRTDGSGDTGGVFRVGPASGASNNARASLVNLATKSTISADLVEISGRAQNGSATLSLGNGTQVINSDDIRMSTSSRDNTAFNFRIVGDGTLKIRGTDGDDATRSNLTMITGVSGGGNKTSTFDVTGNAVDLLFNAVKIYDSTAAATSSATESHTATFSFNSGILDASTFQIGTKSASGLVNNGIATANIGSSANLTNSAALGTVTMGVLSTTGTIDANGKLTPTLNIAGTGTTASFSTLSMANYTGTTGAILTSAVNISGGTTTGTGGINMAAGNKTGITSKLTISGGSLSVGTSGVSATNGIYRNVSIAASTTILLNGGSLDLNGNAIGGSGANAITTTFETGTLSNISEINGGTTGLVKDTAGSLNLSGTNGFTGNTTVTSGTLALNSNLALQKSALDTTGASGLVSLGSGVTTPTLGGLIGSTDLASVIATNYNLVTSLTLNPQSGTVTYSGNIANGASGMTLTKTGAGTQVLSGTNGYTGLTTVSTGTLTLGHASDTLSGDITVSGGTLNIDNPDTVGAITLTSGTISGDSALTGTSYAAESGTVSTELAGSGVALTKTTAGTVTLSGTNTYDGLTTVSDGTLTLGHATDTLSGAITVSGGTLSVSNLDAVGAVTLTSGTISGAGTLTGSSYAVENGTISAKLGGSGVALTKTTAATVILSAQNTYDGLTTVSAGTLTLGHTTDTLDGAITVSGGTLNVDNPDTVGAVTLTSGTISGDSTLTATSYAVESGTISAGLGGSGVTLTKTTSGVVVISGNSTYDGGTFLNEGRLGLRTSGTALGAGTLTINGGTFGSVVSARSFSNNIIVNNDFQIGGVNAPGLGNADTTFNGSVGLGGSTRTITLASGATFTNEISNGGLTLATSGGSRTLNLGGANTYAGATSVGTNVTLAITGTGSINTTSGISVAAGGTLRYNSSTALTVAPSLNGTGTGSGQRAVFTGTGPINASVTLDNLGDVLSPGNSPGTQTYITGQIWASFSYDWELNHFTGTTAGTDFDQIGITGTLDLTGGSGSYMLNVLGLTAGNAAGLVPNFSEINRSWTILTSTGTLTGFNAANWTINTTGFTNPDTGTWLLSQSGDNLVLSYNAIPEPRAALLGGLGMLMLLMRRRA